LVINIGRALEAMTGGLCVATTHRVNLSARNFTAADGSSLGPRYSFPVFQGVSLDLSAKDINLDIPQHIKDLVTDEDVKAEAEATFHAMFENKFGEGAFVSRITSHQDVGARWYPDVLEKALEAQKTFNKRD
jgi:isopenicillin N synthase-like dioxygenase